MKLKEKKKNKNEQDNRILVLENQVNMFQLPTTLNVRYYFILYMNKHNFFTTKFAMPSTVLVGPWFISRAYVTAIFTACNLVLAVVISRVCVSITCIRLAMRATGGTLC